MMATQQAITTLAGCWITVALFVAGCGSQSSTNGDAGNQMPEHTDPPIGFTFEAIGDRSFISFGYSGTVHNIRTPDGTPFGVRTTLCDGPGGVCRFEGPADLPSVLSRRRCLNLTSKSCAKDDDCPDDKTPFRQCVYVYGVPTGVPQVAGTGLFGGCAFSYIPLTAVDPKDSRKPIVGSFDLSTGELNIQNLTLILKQNAAGVFRGTCMECVGDPVPNDGKKEGTCQAVNRGTTDRPQVVDPSPDVGRSCDTHRIGTLPEYVGNYSMDCSPTVTATDPKPTALSSIGGTLTSSGYQIALSTASPSCSDPKFADKKCFCAMCSDGTTPCMSNADCGGGGQCGAPLPLNCDPQPQPFNDDGSKNPDFMPGFSPGQCRTAGVTGTTTRPNTCQGGHCDWNGDTGIGTCTSTLTGRIVGCFPLPTDVGGSMIIARGRVAKVDKVFIADTGNARCLGASTSPAVNAQVGLPGLTFQKRSFRIIPEYAQ